MRNVGYNYSSRAGSDGLADLGCLPGDDLQELPGADNGQHGTGCAALWALDNSVEGVVSDEL
jgi:hypothetical protein